MSGKFAKVPVLAVACMAILTVATGRAQQTPAGSTAPAAPATQTPAAQTPATQTPATQTPATQTPAAQQPDSTQESDEESSSRRKVRPRDYRKWTFNVGAGAELPNGTTRKFVKAGGLLGTAGAARNVNKYLGLRMDFFYIDLPLRDSALEQAQAPRAHDGVYALTLDPIINIPVTKKFTGYVLIGPGFYHRAGKLDSSTTVPGSACNGFWTWWGACRVSSISLSGDFLKSSQNEFGLNFGGGVTHKIRGNLEAYAEFRYLHATNNNISTDARPITIGVRW